MADKKSRGWLTIVYPSERYVRDNFPDCPYDGSESWGSSPDDWIERLTSSGVQAFISPLHQFDTNADGTVKKPHWHVVLLWDGPTTYSNAKSYVDMIKGAQCLPMASLRGAVRYLTHMDNPEKHQYSGDDVRILGGLDYQAVVMSGSDEDLTLGEMQDFIDLNHVYSWRQFNRYCRLYRPDWFALTNRKFRSSLIAYMQAAVWEEDRAGSGLDIGFICP